MRTIGVKNDDFLQLKHKLLTASDTSTLESLQANWLSRLQQMPPLSSANSFTPSPKLNVAVGTIHGYYKNLASAQNDCCKTQPRWYAGYYIRKSKRGIQAHCSTKLNKHQMQEGGLSLRVEYETICPSNIPGFDAKYLLKTEERYFCTNVRCIRSPKDTFSNPKYSNYKVPVLSDISKVELDPRDHQKIESMAL